MIYKILLSFFCFLIISCDLVDESDTDCFGTNFGSAYIDDCGYCVGGLTGLEENYRMDDCSECHGAQMYGGCYECGVSSAINYFPLADETLDTWIGDKENGWCWCPDQDNNGACDEGYPDNDNDGWIDGCFDNDESLCVFDLCDSFPLENTISCDLESSVQRPYQVGDQLGCTDLQTIFSSCYPECDNSFNFLDFEGSVFWLIYEEDW